MTKTLRVRTKEGWVTKPTENRPENRLSAEEIDDNFISIYDEIQQISGNIGEIDDTLSSIPTQIDQKILQHTEVVDPHPQYTTESEVMQILAVEMTKHGARAAKYTTTSDVVLSGIGVQVGGEWDVSLSEGDRILVKDQINSTENGIYVAATGDWSRSPDADTDTKVTPGLLVPVEMGARFADSLWQLTSDGPIILGTTELNFEMAAGKTGVAFGVYDQVSVDTRGRVVGGTRSSIMTISTDFSLTSSNRGLVLVDASSSQRTITLPPSNLENIGVDFIVRRLDNTENRLKVQASGGDKIKFHTHLNSSGYPFFVLMGSGDWWHLRSDGAGSWWPVGRMDSTTLGRPVFDTTTVSPPGGYGPLSGTVFNRLDWPWLWDHAQQSGMITNEAGRVGMEGGWTSGDGSLTFRGPEGRGEFIRILDNTRGVNPGRVAGSSESDMFREHSHTQGFISQTQAGSGGTFWAGTVATSTGLTGGSETRPRNIAYPGRIKLI